MNDGLWRIWDIIDQFELHNSGAPVNLSRLETLCPVSYEDLSKCGIAGFCIATKPATPTKPAKIVVCKTLDYWQRRVVYAHEAAHGIFGHSGAMMLEDMDQWFSDRQEREAWQAAAMMLVPPLDKVQLVDLTMDGLANACHIPRWLLDLYP